MRKKSTLLPSFPQYLIFSKPHFVIICGVLSLHRKSNLPAEESGIEAVRRIGNETQGGTEDAFAAGVITEMRRTCGATRDYQANSGLRYCDLDVEPDLQKIRPIGRHLARDAALSRLSHVTPDCGPFRFASYSSVSCDRSHRCLHDSFAPEEVGLFAIAGFVEVLFSEPQKLLVVGLELTSSGREIPGS
jgi:hypothetical protein